jgi:hypothetical protein
MRAFFHWFLIGRSVKLNPEAPPGILCLLSGHHQFARAYFSVAITSIPRPRFDHDPLPLICPNALLGGCHPSVQATSASPTIPCCRPGTCRRCRKERCLREPKSWLQSSPSQRQGHSDPNLNPIRAICRFPHAFSRHTTVASGVRLAHTIATSRFGAAITPHPTEKRLSLPGETSARHLTCCTRR